MNHGMTGVALFISLILGYIKNNIGECLQMASKKGAHEIFNQ